MNPDLSDALVNGLYIVTILSAMPLLAACCVGIIVSVIQAVTSIQEQLANFIAKSIAITAIIYIFGSSGMEMLSEMFIHNIENVAVLGDTSQHEMR